MSRSIRTRALLALPLVVSLVVGGAAEAKSKPKPVTPVLGPNLAPNPSFEESSVDPATQNGIPVTPTGWSFEGSTVLFDYNQRGGHTGARNIAISGALGGGKEICDHSSGAEQCAPNPAYAQTHQVDDATVGTYSIRPFWTTAAPIPVTAGKSYQLSVWAIMPSLDPNAGVMGEGAATRIRWVDASGKAVSVVDGPSFVKGPKRTLGFKQISGVLTAPAGATGAVLMLGHTDYSHTGTQVAFDDVSFNQVG